jgi:hypothetical protein
MAGIDLETIKQEGGWKPLSPYLTWSLHRRPWLRPRAQRAPAQAGSFIDPNRTPPVSCSEQRVVKGPDTLAN